MEEKNQKDIANLSPKSAVFYTNPKAEYYFEKIKKISLASYLLTDLIKDSEPLKSSIRQIANELIKDTVSLSSDSKIKDKIQQEFLSLKTYFDIGRASKVFSKMNAEIMSGEIHKISLELISDISFSDQVSSLGDHTFFDIKNDTFHNKKVSLEDIYPVKDFLDSSLVDFEKQSEIYKGHYKRHDNVLYKQGQKMSLKNSLNSKNSYQRQTNSGSESSRKNNIIYIIKEKKEVTIKDISLSIRDCSEKTIQRDLISLLGAGIIKKTGERRWSRYSMI